MLKHLNSDNGLELNPGDWGQDANNEWWACPPTGNADKVNVVNNTMQGKLPAPGGKFWTLVDSEWIRILE